MTSPVLTAHFERFRARYGNATLTALASGASLVSVPGCALPQGWSARNVTVRFVAPNGYAVAAPDCFWVEPNLIVSSRGLPKNSAVENQMPETSIRAHWFSWHVEPGKWSPNVHDLLTWMSMCLKRLEIVE